LDDISQQVDNGIAGEKYYL